MKGKTPEQILLICERLAARGDGFLVTRTSESTRAVLAAAYPGAEIDALGRTVLLRAASAMPPVDTGRWW